MGFRKKEQFAGSTDSFNQYRLNCSLNNLWVRGSFQSVANVQVFVAENFHDIAFTSAFGTEPCEREIVDRPRPGDLHTPQMLRCPSSASPQHCACISRLDGRNTDDLFGRIVFSRHTNT